MVYKGIQTATNAVLAIKEIMNIQDEAQMKSEIDILKKVCAWRCFASFVVFMLYSCTSVCFP